MTNATTQAIEFDTATATDIERAFRSWVCGNARTLAELTIIKGTKPEAWRVEAVMNEANLEGLSLDFLTREMVLAGLVARADYQVLRSLRKEYESALYGYALTLLETTTYTEAELLMFGSYSVYTEEDRKALLEALGEAERTPVNILRALQVTGIYL